MNYEIVIESKESVFHLVDDAVAKVEPGGSRELIVAFSPSDELSCSAILIIKTQLESKTISLSGFGNMAMFKK